MRDISLSHVPRLFATNTTVSTPAFCGENQVWVVNTASVVITLPTPIKDLCYYSKVIVCYFTPGQATLSGTFVGGSSYTMDAYTTYTLRCIPVANGTYKWSCQSGEAIGTGITQEQLEDYVGAMVTGNTETFGALSYDDATGKINFAGTKASGAEITAGTEDGKIVTPKAIADSDIPTAIASGAEVNAGTDNAKAVTAKAIADSDIAFLTDIPSNIAGFDYKKTGRTGGTANDLDGLVYAGLADGDSALVVVGNNPGIAYAYVFDDDKDAVESDPSVIKPDDAGASLGRWVLASTYTVSTSVSDWQEAVEDTVGAMIATTSSTYFRGITPTYTDGSGLLYFVNDGFKWVKSALTGVGGLDTIAVASCTDGDRARVVASGVVYDFYFVAAATDAEDSPRKIRPDDYSAAGVWYLCTYHGSAQSYGTEPGAISTSTSGQAGTAVTASRSDHCHDLGTHTHADNTVGGTIASTAISDWQEAVEDTTATMIVTTSVNAHRGITPAYTDGSGILAFTNDVCKWVKTALTGAGGLDTVAIAGISDGDRARVVASGVVYDFYFVAAATDAEASPVYIRPDDYATAGVWYLCKSHASALPAGITAVATAAFTPTLGWAGGAAPTVTTEVYRQKTIYDRCFWTIDIAGTDGGGSTTLTVDFPAALVPTDRNALVPCKAQVSVNAGAYANVLATLDCEAADAADRQLTVATGTLTDDQAFRIIISGDHEITPA